MPNTTQLELRRNKSCPHTQVISVAGFCSATPLIGKSTPSPTRYNYPLNGGNRVIDLHCLIS